MVTSRDTARATTPSAVPNGARVSNSPCATAAITGAGALGTAGHDLGEQLQPGSDVGVGARPAQPALVDPVGGGQHVQPCQRLQRRALPHADQVGLAALQRLRDAQRSGENRVFHDRDVELVVEFAAAAIQHRRGPADRSAASAAVTGQRRRLARWRCARPSASRAWSLAAATPGSSISGASGSAVIGAAPPHHVALHRRRRRSLAPLLHILVSSSRVGLPTSVAHRAGTRALPSALHRRRRRSRAVRIASPSVRDRGQ